MQTVLIAGGSGLVGSRLTTLLQAKGYRVSHLSRRADPGAAVPRYAWDLDRQSIAAEAVAEADYVINLAGAGIADRLWSKSRKQLIIDSRVKGNELLNRVFQDLDTPPKAYLSASAVGYYGHTGERTAAETAEPGQGFLTDSVLEWEKAIEPIAQSGMRTGVVRIGIVLSTRGGALQKMLPSYMVNVGAYFGNGRQYYSWIHLDDLCRMFIEALERETYRGTYNAVGPQPATVEQIARTIAKAMDKRALIVPAPAPALRLAMGEMADMLLFSTRVSSEKIEKLGFQFQFPELEGSLRDLLQRKI